MKMLLYSSKKAILLLSLSFSTYFLPLASAQFSNVFIKPPPSGENVDFSQNPTWYLGVDQQIQWNTSSSSYYIALFQQQIGGGIQGDNVYQTSSNGSGPNEINWTVDIGNFKIATSNVFFFWVFPEDDTEKFTSHYFYVANKSSASSTRTASTSSSSSILSSTTTSSTTSSTTISTTSPATPSITLVPSTPPASPTNKTGLGVGIGVGIGAALLLGCLIAFIYFKKRRSKRARAAQVSNHQTGSNNVNSSALGGSNLQEQDKSQYRYTSNISELPQSLYPTTGIAELPHHRDPAEMPEE